MNWYYQHLCIGNIKNKAKQLALTRYIWPILNTFGWYTIWEGSAKVKLRWLSGACLTFYQAQKRIKNGANGYHQFAAAFFAIYQYILSTLMSTRACVCVVLTIINCILTKTLFISIWREKTSVMIYSSGKLLSDASSQAWRIFAMATTTASRLW